MNGLFIAALVALLVMAHCEVFAGDTGTMICRGGIVSIGDTAGELLSKCGQPAYGTQREQKRVEGGAKNTRERFITSISIDDWIFNFGPNEFQYQVLLENGRVARIQSLGYGY